MKKFLCFLTIFAIISCSSSKIEEPKVQFLDFEPYYIKVSNKKDNVKTKFYNFDELLIEGQYKKPQLLYTDAKQKVKFERLLKLKKDLLPKLKNTQSDPTLR